MTSTAEIRMLLKGVAKARPDDAAIQVLIVAMNGLCDVLDAHQAHLLGTVPRKDHANDHA